MTEEELYEQKYWEDWYQEKEWEEYILDDLRKSDLNKGAEKES